MARWWHSFFLASLFTLDLAFESGFQLRWCSVSIACCWCVKHPVPKQRTHSLKGKQRSERFQFLCWALQRCRWDSLALRIVSISLENWFFPERRFTWPISTERHTSLVWRVSQFRHYAINIPVHLRLQCCVMCCAGTYKSFLIEYNTV